MTRSVVAVLCMLSSLWAEIALAHPGHGIGESFLAWLGHVFTSPDHLLGFVAVAALAIAVLGFARRGRSNR